MPLTDTKTCEVAVSELSARQLLWQWGIEGVLAMGMFEDMTEVFEAPFKIASGVVNGVKDGVSLVDNARKGDMGGVMQDGLKLMNDANDLVEGLTTLGAAVTPLPTAFGASKGTQIADSKIIWAAQMLIDGMKLTTGDGTPVNGDEFRESSKRLEDVVLTLISAEPHSDRWDGTSSQVYNAVNASHRRLASQVQAADEAIAGVLDTEAGQVARTRETLQDQNDWLKAYDLATCWMQATGPGRAIKVVLDTAASVAALDIAGGTMVVLVKNSLENSARITSKLDTYTKAQGDTSGPPASEGLFKPFPEDDLPGADKKQPGSRMPKEGEDIPPERTQPRTPYTVPSPEEPEQHGPPATPYGAPMAPTPTAPLPAGIPPAAPGAAPQPAGPAPSAAPKIAATPMHMAPAAFTQPATPTTGSASAPAAAQANSAPQPPRGPASASQPSASAGPTARSATERAPILSSPAAPEGPQPPAAKQS